MFTHLGLLRQIAFPFVWRLSGLLAAVAAMTISADTGGGYPISIAFQASQRVLLSQPWSAHEPEPSTAADFGTSKDSELPCGVSSGASVARVRKGTGYGSGSKSYSLRATADPLLARIGDVLSRSFGPFHADAQVSWPMGKSAAESVVLLQRLRR